MGELTQEFCLREIARNMHNYEDWCGMRIGRSRIDTIYHSLGVPYTYEVTDWDGNKSIYTDLLQAIDAFIEVNNSK